MIFQTWIPLPVRRALIPLLWFREELQYDMIQAGWPALLVGTELRNLPDCFEGAQYALKTHWTDFVREGNLPYLIQAAEFEARLAWCGVEPTE